MNKEEINWNMTDAELKKEIEEYQEMLDAPKRVNLKKYYPIVKNCQLCKKEYGVDFALYKSRYGKYENGICPTCQYRLQAKKSIVMKGGR